MYVQHEAHSRFSASFPLQLKFTSQNRPKLCRFCLQSSRISFLSIPATTPCCFRLDLISVGLKTVIRPHTCAKCSPLCNKTPSYHLTLWTRAQADSPGVCGRLCRVFPGAVLWGSSSLPLTNCWGAWWSWSLRNFHGSGDGLYPFRAPFPSSFGTKLSITCWHQPPQMQYNKNNHIPKLHPATFWTMLP